ncbi:MAG: hypothetical protein IBV52_02955 [Candidatus Bathyarchaeota archaeon]
MMNKKILLSILAIGLVASLAGAGLYAVFTDTESSTGNTFTAGKLDISLGTSSWSTGFDNMKPGDTVTFTITVGNDGTLPLDYTITPVLSGDLSTGTYGCFVQQIRVDSVVTASDSLSVAGQGDRYDTVEIDITMPLNAGNWYQERSGTLDVTFAATQQ